MNPPVWAQFLDPPAVLRAPSMSICTMGILEGTEKEAEKEGCGRENKRCGREGEIGKKLH